MLDKKTQSNAFFQALSGLSISLTVCSLKLEATADQPKSDGRGHQLWMLFSVMGNLHLFMSGLFYQLGCGFQSLGLGDSVADWCICHSPHYTCDYD